MKIHKNDKVKVLSGKDKGKVGTVLMVLPKLNKIIVEGINMAKRHVKPGVVSKDGGIISIEKAIDASNVMYFDEKSKKTIRLGFSVNKDGKKVRVDAKTKKALEK